MKFVPYDFFSGSANPIDIDVSHPPEQHDPAGLAEVKVDLWESGRIVHSVVRTDAAGPVLIPGDEAGIPNGNIRLRLNRATGLSKGSFWVSFRVKKDALDPDPEVWMSPFGALRIQLTIRP